jgi:hypothetical protein
MTLRKPVPGARSLPQLWREICAAATPLELGDVLRTLHNNGMVPPVPVIDFCPPRDEWLQLIRDGSAFGWGALVAAGGVGNFQGFELLNPSGSGKRALVRYFSAADINGTLRRWIAALGAHNAGFGTAATATNLNAGGAGSVMTLTTGAAAALDATGIFYQRTSTNYVESPLPQGLFTCELGEGQALRLWMQTTNLSFDATLLYAEVAAGNAYP